MSPHFSIITTCKGRLHHLKQSLPEMLAQPALEVIVVDYDCPDGTSDWVTRNYPTATVVRAEDDKGFCAARARNIGAAHAKGEWLAFVDADNLVNREWLGWISQRLSARSYFIIDNDKMKRDAAGALVCRRTDFLLAGRYDEAIRGWGAEDTDLRVRLSSLGLEAVLFPFDHMQPISHTNETRQTVNGLSLEQIRVRNQLFLRAKKIVNDRFGGMEKCCREALIQSLSLAATKGGPEKVKHYYPVRFFRYCPNCAEKMSCNSEITLHRQPASLFRRKRFYVSEAQLTAAWQLQD
jgi:hypothetical protein